MPSMLDEADALDIANQRTHPAKSPSNSWRRLSIHRATLSLRKRYSAHQCPLSVPVHSPDAKHDLSKHVSRGETPVRFGNLLERIRSAIGTRNFAAVTLRLRDAS